MENLIDSLKQFNLGGDLHITPEFLYDTANMMKSQNISSLNLADFLKYMYEISGNKEPTTPNIPKGFDDDSFFSPNFTFKSPSKPFTPFQTKPMPEESEMNQQFEKINIQANSTKESNQASNDQNAQFSGFFDTARNSIPNYFSSPASARKEQMPNTMPPPNDDDDDDDLYTQFHPSFMKAESPKSNKVTPESTKSDTTTESKAPFDNPLNGKAWFWGNDSNEVPTKNSFEIPNPTFNLGSTFSSNPKSKGKKAKSNSMNSNTSSTEKEAREEGPFTTNTASSAAFKVHTVGEEDKLHSLNEEGSYGSFSDIGKDLGGLGTDLEDDDMSIDDDKIPLGATKDPIFGHENKKPFDFDEFDFQDEFKTKLNTEPNFDIPHTERSTQKGGIDDNLSNNFGNINLGAGIGFNLGAAPNNTFQGPKSARKTSTKKKVQSTKKEPNNIHPMNDPLNPQQFNDQGNLNDVNSQSQSNTAPFPPFTADFKTDEDIPPSWWQTQSNQPQTPPRSARQNIPNRSSPAHDKASTLPPEPNYKTQNEQNSQHSDQSMLGLAELYSKQGKELYAIGLYDRALDAYTKCLNLAPKLWVARATILGNRAATFFMIHRFMECVNDCDDALNLDPTAIKLHIRKGKAFIKLGHFNPADAAFSKVLECNVNDFEFIPSLPSQEIEAKLALEQVIESAKLEAKAGLRELDKLKESVKLLITLESKMDFEEVLKTTKDLLSKSPNHRASQIARAHAYNELSFFEDAKGYIEEITISQAEKNIQRLYAHPSAKFPCPSIDSLDWKEIKSPNGLSIDVNSVVNMILCIGSELGFNYLVALKNVKMSRYYCADVMNKIFQVLTQLDQLLSLEEKSDSWVWVSKELSKIKELISIKNTADLQFKNKNFRAALNSYGSALRVDITARRWSAILYSNRAATLMSLGMFAEAVADCHNSVNKDPGYSRAYLRRARAYRSMLKQNESVRDYRRYLNSDPIPSDFKDVQKELSEMLEAKTEEPKKPQSSSSHHQSSYQNRPNSGKNAFDDMKKNSNSRQSNFSNFNQTNPNTQSSNGTRSRPGSNYNNSAKPDSSKFKSFDDRFKSWSYNFEEGLLSSDESEEEPASRTFGEFSLKETDHYKILGIDTAANDREIKISYRKLALKYHPDKNKEDGAEDRFKMISLAYSVLSDKSARREYDLSRPLSRGNSRKY